MERRFILTCALTQAGKSPSALCFDPCELARDRPAHETGRSVPEDVIFEIRGRAMIPRLKRPAPGLHYPGNDNPRHTRIGGPPGHPRLQPKCRQNLEARNLFLRPNGEIVVARLD